MPVEPRPPVPYRRAGVMPNDPVQDVSQDPDGADDDVGEDDRS